MDNADEIIRAIGRLEGQMQHTNENIKNLVEAVKDDVKGLRGDHKALQEKLENVEEEVREVKTQILVAETKAKTVWAFVTVIGVSLGALADKGLDYIAQLFK